MDRTALAATLALSLSPAAAHPHGPVVGQGDHRYTVHEDWAGHDPSTHPLKNVHGIVHHQGLLYALGDHDQNNVLVFDKAGTLQSSWTLGLKGAHGLSLAGGALYITDTATNAFFKTTLAGEVLRKWDMPDQSALYRDAGHFKPSKTIHREDGGFYVLDGYGKDYVHQYGADGTYLKSFGGDLGEGEARLKQWGPHGGGIDARDPGNPALVLALSDQQKLKRFTLDGSYIDTIPMPGGNPRDIVPMGEFLLVPHLADNWPQDRDSNGFISVLDRDFKVVANLGGPAPVYRDGVLQKLSSDKKTFRHPHGVCTDDEGNIYVTEYASGKRPPIKLAPKDR